MTDVSHTTQQYRRGWSSLAQTVGNSGNPIQGLSSGENIKNPTETCNNVLRLVFLIQSSPSIENFQEPSQSSRYILLGFTYGGLALIVKCGEGVADATSLTYLYDANNMRVRLKTSNTTSTIIASPAYSVENGTPVKYISAGGQLVATIRDTGVSAAPYYIHVDHLGSQEKTTNSTGTIMELTDYYPYGAQRQNTGSILDRKGYIGVDTDFDTGLSQAGARYYSSAVGRFISQDPLFWDDLKEFLADPQQLNSYSYGRNNPIRYNDSSGKSARDAAIGLLNAFLSNNALGTGRVSPSDYSGGNRQDYLRGQALGDLASALLGYAESMVGGGIAAGGVLATAGSGFLLSPVSVPATAAGAALAAHGAANAVGGIYNFSKDLQGLNSGGSNDGKSVAEQIADGHAFNDHAKEFGPGVTKEQFRDHAENIINNPSEVKNLERGRTGYWDNQSDTVVIHNPSDPDGGTMFRPENGKSYFDNELK